MSFTFSDNNTYPVALLKSGKKARFIYIEKDKAEEAEEEVKDEQPTILDEKLDDANIAAICESFMNGITIRELYTTLTASSSGKPQAKFFKSFKLKPGEEIETIPGDRTERVFIGGESGCGKSRIVGKYARDYAKVFPDNRLFFFVREEDDPEFEGIERQEIVLGNEISDDAQALLDGEMNLPYFDNSLVVFDDMDNIQDKKVITAVHKLMNDLSTNGRKRGVSVIYVSHLLSNYSQTRVMINEANKVFFFPGCGTAQIESFLEKKASFKKKQSEVIAQMSSRWVMLHKSMPRYILHEKGIFFL